jgi:hypothetical protein
MLDVPMEKGRVIGDSYVGISEKVKMVSGTWLRAPTSLA